MKKIKPIFALLLISAQTLLAQINPAAQVMPFLVDFGASTFTSMPTGTAAWGGMSGATISSQTAAEASMPTTTPTVTAQTASTTTGGSYGYANAGSNNGRYYVQTSSNTTNGVNQLAASVTLAMGNNSITVGYDIEVILVGTVNRTFGSVLQYRAGTSGSWTSASSSGIEYSPSSSNGGDSDIAGDMDSYSFTVSGLTPGDYQFRWAVWRGPSSGGSGNSAGGAFDNLSFSESFIAPVTLDKFTATSTTTTLLSFSTATEINNDYFAIERSSNGSDFTEIGQVKGAGSTRIPQQYTFTDQQPLPGKNYYRLRQVDFDGRSAYSTVVSVVFSKTGDLTLAPSPATDLVLIHLDQPAVEDGVWQVFDVAGRLLQSDSWLSETQETSINVGLLPEGMYTFRLAVGQTVIVKQFKKQ